jgi:hypothetical protein
VRQNARLTIDACKIMDEVHIVIHGTAKRRISTTLPPIDVLQTVCCRRGMRSTECSRLWQTAGNTVQSYSYDPAEKRFHLAVNTGIRFFE